jgi:ribonuclease PH
MQNLIHSTRLVVSSPAPNAHEHAENDERCRAVDRADGRGDEEPRPLVVALDVVTAAAGSSYVELGSTKVSCAVYGPRQNELAETTRVERGTLNVDVRFAAHVDGKRWRAAEEKPWE